MAGNATTSLATLVARQEAKLLQRWIKNQLDSGLVSAGQISEAELKAKSQQFLRESLALKSGEQGSINGEQWAAVRALLGDISRSRALQGFSPSETATFIFSLKEPVFEQLREHMRDDAQRLVDEIWTSTQLLDKLGLYTMEVFQKSREEIVQRQGQELLELSTPVVQLWDRILALPLIGTLDSERTQT